MEGETITAVIPAKNEEKNITRCIKSVAWCNKIIVMWMGDDKTGTIAKKMGAQVVEMNKGKKDDFVAVQKNINWAIDHCQTDWILRIDADEVVTTELKEEILSILKSQIPNPKSQTNSKFKILNSKFVAYGIPRAQYFLGDFLRGGDWAYDRLVRLFKKGFARYEPIVAVHEQFKVKGKIGYLKNPLLHFSHPTLKEVFRKFNSYTDVQVNDIHDHLFTAVVKMVILPPYIFLRWLIYHHGWRDGWRGVVAGTLRAWYEFILYKKYLQRFFFSL
jgi:glycosyltransferase involved in cell wall biosynthesis